MANIFSSSGFNKDNPIGIVITSGVVCIGCVKTYTNSNGFVRLNYPVVVSENLNQATGEFGINFFPVLNVTNLVETVDFSNVSIFFYLDDKNLNHSSLARDYQSYVTKVLQQVSAHQAGIIQPTQKDIENVLKFPTK